MNNNLFTNFTKSSKQDWVDKATQDLKGIHPNDKFNWEIEPSIVMAPYYDLEDISDEAKAFQNKLYEDQHPSGEIRHWDNLQVINVDAEKKANKIILDALNSGAEGVVLSLLKNSEINLAEILYEVSLEHCSIWFQVNDKLLPLIIDFLKGKNFNGGFICNNNDQINTLYEHFSSNNNVYFISTKANEGQQFTDKIASVLFQLVQTADKLITSKEDPNHFFKKHAIQYTLNTDFFGEIASIRAIRQLHYQIACVYGATKFEPQDLHIQCISTVWNNDAYNPHANMLKGTTAGMASILGGCNSLIVKPADQENSTMQRIARNVSSIIKEEAYFNSNNDPVAGAYFIENLTQQLAKEAWKKFQQKIKNN